MATRDVQRRSRLETAKQSIAFEGAVADFALREILESGARIFGISTDQGGYVRSLGGADGRSGRYSCTMD